jgi:hypothetical protein
MPVTEENAAEYATAIYERFKGRMEAYLAETAKLFREQGWNATDPMDMSGDDYEWAILVAPAGHDPLKSDRSIAVEFEVCEAMEYDGTPGVSFKIDLIGSGGYIVGGLAPYNYTDECWVPMDDEAAIETRFLICEQSDFTELFNTCAGWTPPAA